MQTERTQSHNIKMEKLRTHMIEAAEQCERTALPSLDPITKLTDMLEQWPADRHLFFADERIHSTGEGSFRKALVAHAGLAAISLWMAGWGDWNSA